MHKLLVIAITLTAVTGFACLACNSSKTEEPALDYGYEYYPLRLGQYYEYQVDSVVYRRVVGGIARDSSVTFVRELIADTLRDAAGELVYRLEQYERKSDTLPWQIRGVYAVSRNEEEAYRMENNLRFVKLRFPVREGKKWSAHRYFDEFLPVSVAGQPVEIFRYWEGEVEATGLVETIANATYEDIALVFQADNDTGIELRRVVEMYSRGVGLVFREMNILDGQCESMLCDSLSWDEKAEAGFVLRQYLLNHN